MDIQKELFKYEDKEYKDFHSKLIPTVNPKKIIGVRTPQLRKFAKELFKLTEYRDFLNALPHFYYEENNLHAFLIEQIKNFDEAVLQTERFLPFIDNWATCDMFRPKVFVRNPDKILKYAKKWITAKETYTIRYAIGILHSYFLDENFSPEYLELVASVKSDEYYVNMMIAWFFATALSKQYESAVLYLTKKSLPVWVHNKTIQKAIESNRIDIKTKGYLKTLKIK